MRKLTYLSSLVVIFLFALIGCEKDSVQSTNNNSTETATISLENTIPHLTGFNNILSSTNLKSNDNLSNLNLTANTRLVDGSNLNDIVYQSLPTNDKVYGIIYFVRKDILQGIGIHYFSAEKSNNIFELYSINNNDYKRELSFITSEVTFFSLSYLSVNLFDNSNIEMIFPTILSRESTTNDFNDLHAYAEIELIKTPRPSARSGNKALDRGSYQGCGVVGLCKTTTGNVCHPTFHCQEGGGLCPQQSVLDFSSANASSGDHDDLVNSGEIENIYRFRDLFLYNSEAGTQYSETFYQISEQLYDALDLQVLAKITAVMPAIDNATQLLFDTDYTGVIIDANLRDDVLEITGDLKANSVSSVFINEVEQFETDFNILSLKNRTEIDNEMENL